MGSWNPSIVHWRNAPVQILHENKSAREKAPSAHDTSCSEFEKGNDRILERYGAVEYAARWKRIEESFKINHHRKLCNEEYISGVKSNTHNLIRVSKDGLTSGIDVTAEDLGNVRFH